MSDPLDPLRRELDRWAAEERRATLWWRDDDAVEATPRLLRMLEVATRRAVPLALAVVPARASPSLAEALQARPLVAVVQHGFSHRNHAPAGAKKAELGNDRPLAAMADELASGLAVLRAMLGARLLSVIVPPWNRMAPDLYELLPHAGFVGVSTYGPRRTRAPARGLLQINTHVDVVDWRGSRGFIGVQAMASGFAGHLAARRTGEADPEEPTGLLTHHLMLEDADWQAIDGLLQEVKAHPATRWLSVESAFAAA